MFAKEVYIERRKQLCARTADKGIILLPANGESSKNYPSNTYPFRQDSTFLYFFGLNKADYVGVLDLDSGEETLFADDVSLNDIIWMGESPSVRSLADRVGVEYTQTLSELDSYIKNAISAGRRIHYLPAYTAEKKILLSSLTGIDINMINAQVSVELALAVISLREVKSELEIAELEKASAIGYAMQTQAMRMCRVGIKEREIAGAIEAIALQQGEGVSFTSIVTQNGQTLHNHYYGNTLSDGRLLLVDCGAENSEFYCSDLTRTFPINGRFSSRQKDIYDIVLRANNYAFELSQPGVLYMDIHLKVATQMSEELKSLGLIRGNVQDAVEKGAYSLFMPHGLGHMLGMDVHDMENIGENYVGYDEFTARSKRLGVSSLRMGRKLKAGFVMTVEPGIYFIPDYIAKWRAEGINNEFINFEALESYLDFGGIRIEDDMLITKGGNRMIGQKRAPVSTEEIEEFMKK